MKIELEINNDIFNTIIKSRNNNKNNKHFLLTENNSSFPSIIKNIIFLEISF